jgi:hypothetical protein
MLAMLDTRHNLSLGSGTTFELVSNQNPWRITQALGTLAKESLGSLPVAPALHEDVQDMTVLVDCAPEVMVLALDRRHDLVEVRFVAPSWLTPAQLSGKLLAKRQCPLADRLVGHNDTPACHQLLDVAKAQRETVVELYHMADDLPGVAEAAVKLGTCHPSILSRRDQRRQLDSTKKAPVVGHF